MNMKLSLAIPSMETFSSIQELENLFQRVSRIGYGAVEPLIGVLKRRSEEYYVNTVHPLLTRYNLKISAFRTGQIYSELGWGFSESEKEKREKAVSEVEKVIRLSSHFPGSKLYNGLIQGPVPLGCTQGEIKNYVFDCFSACLRVAEEENVDFCVEAVNRYELGYNNTLQEVYDFIKTLNSDKVKLLIDTFHMNIEEGNLTAAIEKTYDKIGGVHFMDSNRLPPGFGHLDLKAVYSKLVDMGFRDYFTIEMTMAKTDEKFFSYAEEGLAECRRIMS